MKETNSVLLSTAYFPPVSYLVYMLSSKKSFIEVHENYTKQSYRNRCKILSPNGVQSISVPVEKGSFHKVALKDLRVDYSRPWQQNHIRTLKTAYNSSAFYEFLKDDIEACIRKEHRYLLDLNMKILELIVDLLDLDIDYESSTKFELRPEKMLDLRSLIHPKENNPELDNLFPEYFQVFSPGKGFTPGLSILDLIFNMGPEAYSYLNACKLLLNENKL